MSVCVIEEGYFEKREIKRKRELIMWTSLLVFLNIKVLDTQIHINKDKDIHMSLANHVIKLNQY